MIFFVFIVFIKFCFSIPGTSPLLKAENPNLVVPNRYIIRFDEDKNGSTALKDVTRYLLPFNQRKSFNIIKNVDSQDLPVINGATLTLDKKQLNRVRNDPRVLDVEEVQILETFEEDDLEMMSSPENLQADFNQNKFLEESCKSQKGDGVDVYILDTGIEKNHSQLAGKVFDFYTVEENNFDDENGHGTHCAGSIVSDKYGLATSARIFNVKIFEKNGKGTTENALKAINYIAMNKDHSRPSIASFSVGCNHSPSLDAAVQNLIDSGVIVVAAAGNKNKDACLISPPSVADAITVASCDSSFNKVYSSNYGSCVDIITPGTNIMSTWINNDFKRKSGTSMAVPRVTSVIALYLSCHPHHTLQQVTDFLINYSIPNYVRGFNNQTPNRLLRIP